VSFCAVLLVLACPGPATGAGGAQESALAPILKRLPMELPSDETRRWRDYEEGSDLASYGVSEATARAILGLREHYLERRYPRVLSGLYEVLEAEADLPEALSMLGLSYFRLRRYGDAAHVYERLLAASPKLRGRTLALGHCYYSLGDYPKAREHYLSLRALRPQDGAVQRGLALAQYRLGEEDVALELFEDLLARELEVSESHYWLGRIHYDGGEPEKARPHAAALVELQPFDNRAWYLWMQVLYDLGEDEAAREAEVRWREIDRATQELRRIDAQLALEPERFDLLLRKVEVNRELGNLEGVRATVPKMLRVTPHDVDGVALHGFAIDLLMGMGDREGALWVAGVMETRYAEEKAAWDKLVLLYGVLRMRTDQIRAGRRADELAKQGGDVEDGGL